MPDLPGAMALLGPALNVRWTAVRPSAIVPETPAGPTSTEIAAVYSREGPPSIELVSGGRDGSFFAAGARASTPRGNGAGDPRGSAFVENALGLTLEAMAQWIREVLYDWSAITD